MHNVSAYKVAAGSEHFMADEHGAVYHIDRGIADWFEAYPPANTAESYEIPVGVYAIGDCAFDWCKNLKTVTLPYTLTEIYHWAFSECTSLTSVYFRSGMPVWAGDYIFGDNPNEDLVLYFPYGSEGWENLTVENPDAEWTPNEVNYSYTVRGYSYEIPDELLSAGMLEGGVMWWMMMKDGVGVLKLSGSGEIPDFDHEGAGVAPWMPYRQMIQSVRIGCESGDNITRIGNFSFYHAGNITEVEIGNSVKSIGHKAFDYTGLTSFVLPAGVEHLDDGALAWMNGVDAFEVAEGNEHFKTIDGVLYTMDGQGLVAYPTGRDDESYTVPEGVVDIWGHAFEGAKFTSVVLPDSLRFIYGCAFDGSSLKEMTVPASVEFIDINFLNNCENLTAVRFYGDLPEIGGTMENRVGSYSIVCRIDADGWADSVFAEAGILRYFGDVSGDGVLDTSDTDLLTRYFAGWKVQIDPAVLDFNNDGETNRKDAMILARKIAGWDIQ